MNNQLKLMFKTKKCGFRPQMAQTSDHCSRESSSWLLADLWLTSGHRLGHWWSIYRVNWILVHYICLLCNGVEYNVVKYTSVQYTWVQYTWVPFSIYDARSVSMGFAPGCECDPYSSDPGDELHCTALHYTALHSGTLHFTELSWEEDALRLP